MTAPELELTARALVAPGKGILAADESDGTIKKRFDSIDVESTEDNRRGYRELLFTTEGVEDYISGVILYDETIRQKASDGTPFPELLASKGVIPGIKVDLGAKALALAPEETITEGLDGLRGRLEEYRTLGARFAKWRATYSIGDHLPSEYCAWTNAHALARYAALCQEAGIVPIVEPEVLQDGAHTIDESAKATGRVLQARVHRACATSGSTTAERCSSRTWSCPATGQRTARASTKWPSGHSMSSTATSQQRCPGSCSSPAASRTRTRPRTSTR